MQAMKLNFLTSRLFNSYNICALTWFPNFIDPIFIGTFGTMIENELPGLNVTVSCSHGIRSTCGVAWVILSFDQLSGSTHSIGVFRLNFTAMYNILKKKDYVNKSVVIINRFH
jgi:hypothetical protein